MRDGIDLLTIDPAAAGAVLAQTFRLRPILTADLCRHLLADLDRWNRHHAATMCALAASPDWQR